MARPQTKALKERLAIAEAEEALIAAKAKADHRCGECGRRGPRTKAEQKAIDKAKANLRKARQPFRERRGAPDAD